MFARVWAMSGSKPRQRSLCTKHQVLRFPQNDKQEEVMPRRTRSLLFLLCALEHLVTQLGALSERERHDARSHRQHF